MELCKICDACPVVTRGRCGTCYSYLRRTGRDRPPELVARQPRLNRRRLEGVTLAGRREVDPEVRFWAKVRFGDHPKGLRGSCWEWIGALSDEGYGRFQLYGSTVYAHRFAYENIVGPVPSGLQLDHLCRTRHCVNPWHLDPVTGRENYRRSLIGNAAKTHCPQGHEYDLLNTYFSKEGRRGCRICRAEAMRRFHGKKSESA